MEVIKEIQELRQWVGPTSGQDLGLVPTMGYLHQGHLSLVERACAENRRVAASIFVNPTQFNDPADLERYPRNEERDLDLLEKAGVDAVFLPQPEVIYPPGFSAQVKLGGITETLEGKSRPGHFDGVTTVVAKLFNLFTPAKAYFGQKDAQQLLVIQKMVRDLNFPVRVVACPTQREADGLALSSRNVRLSEAQRAQAPVLYQALSGAAQAVREGQTRASALIAQMKAVIEAQPEARVDYIAVNEPNNLEPLQEINQTALVSLAVYFGSVRLIDNLMVEP